MTSSTCLYTSRCVYCWLSATGSPSRPYLGNRDFIQTVSNQVELLSGVGTYSEHTAQWAAIFCIMRGGDMFDSESDVSGDNSDDELVDVL